MKAQAAIHKGVGVLTRAGVFKPLKKAAKLGVSTKAVVVKSIKKARPTSGKRGSVLANVPARYFTLTWWKCYLDSCATYHSFFMEELLCDVKEGKFTTNGSYNADTVATNTKGWYEDFEVWLNEMVIVNLLLIPMLEDDGYLVSIHTHGNRVVILPKGKKIIFKEDIGVCSRMPYIDLRKKNQESFAMVETVCKKFAGATRRDIEKGYIVQTMDAEMGTPTPDERFEEIVSLGENGCF